MSYVKLFFKIYWKWQSVNYYLMKSSRFHFTSFSGQENLGVRPSQWGLYGLTMMLLVTILPERSAINKVKLNGCLTVHWNFDYRSKGNLRVCILLHVRFLLFLSWDLFWSLSFIVTWLFVREILFNFKVAKSTLYVRMYEVKEMNGMK